MQKPWSLYNKEDKLRVDDLTSEQVRVILLSTANSRMAHWYACQEGDVHWQPIHAIQEFYEDVRQIKGLPEDAAKPAPPSEPEATKPLARRPLFEDAPEVRTEPSLQIESVQTKERRSARRYPRFLQFRIVLNDQTFTAETSDISMSGLSIKAPLPAWVPRTFHAELSMNKTVVKILCSKVTDQQLKIKDCSAWDVIRAWLVNW